MTTFIAAIDRTSRSIRRTVYRIAARLTRKASIKLAITISLPPFLKLAIDYKADLSKAATGMPNPTHENSTRRVRYRIA